MSSAEILLRVSSILSKYEKYDPTENETKKGKMQPAADDAFSVALYHIEMEVMELQEKADEIQGEVNRATVATQNAELRRSKNALITTDVPKLEKLAKKGKGLKKVDVDARLVKIDDLVDKIQAIPDGLSARFTSASKRKRKIKLSDGQITEMVGGISKGDVTANAAYTETTEESRAFAEEWRQEKQFQDGALDEISQGLTDLKDISVNIGEELDRQTPLVDTIETKLDDASTDLKSQNAKLKSLVTQVRSTRNFCIDVTLICILLGCGAYIYSMVK